MLESTLKIKFTELELEVNDFAHVVWQQVEAAPLVKYWSGTDANVGRHAEARLAFNPEYLFIRFDCKQEETLTINDKPSLTEKTIGLWEKDVCELFISPNIKNPGQYFEFEAAPTGEWLDLGIVWSPDERKTDWDYASGMETSAEISEEGILILMKIPWTAFGKTPDFGEKWRGNLYRCVGSGENRGYLAWQPTFTPQPNFHVPEAFGSFEFIR
jgi:hypothetical protein